MSENDVLLEKRDAVALLTLNRAKYKNAQSYDLLDELDNKLDAAVADEDVKVIVLRGDGDHFSSGHDLGTPDQKRRLDQIPEQGLEYYDSFRKYNYDLTFKWRNLPKPTIAMVHGYCIYGGWMIATAMDVIFASPDARFLAGLFEYFSVPWDMHPRAAKELIFESRFIDAHEAKELGLVNRVIDRERLEQGTLDYAARVAESPMVTLRLAKLAVNKAQDQQGYATGVEAAFADYLVLQQTRGTHRVAGGNRMGGVELALRGERGERPGQTPTS